MQRQMREIRHEERSDHLRRGRSTNGKSSVSSRWKRMLLPRLARVDEAQTKIRRARGQAFMNSSVISEVAGAFLSTTSFAEQGPSALCRPAGVALEISCALSCNILQRYDLAEVCVAETIEHSLREKWQELGSSSSRCWPNRSAHHRFILVARRRCATTRRGAGRERGERK